MGCEEREEERQRATYKAASGGQLWRARRSQRAPDSSPEAERGGPVRARLILPEPPALRSQCHLLAQWFGTQIADYLLLIRAPPRPQLLAVLVTCQLSVCWLYRRVVSEGLHGRSARRVRDLMFYCWQASNYESIYEPIQPRIQHSPAGSMSSLTRPSHYSPNYPAYSSTTGGTPTAYGGKTPPKRPVQEEDVDALTNLLVQSMDNAADPEFFG